MNEIQIFQNKNFGQIRTIIINDEVWFVGKDVAETLGYSNPQKAIRDHIDEEDKTLNELFTVNGTRGILINESGLYSLILSSKLPQAKEFKRWVTDEVLQSIRKHGGILNTKKNRRSFVKSRYLNIISYNIKRRARKKCKINTCK